MNAASRFWGKNDSSVRDEDITIVDIKSAFTRAHERLGMRPSSREQRFVEGWERGCSWKQSPGEPITVSFKLPASVHDVNSVEVSIGERSILVEFDGRTLLSGETRQLVSPSGSVHTIDQRQRFVTIELCKAKERFWRSLFMQEGGEEVHEVELPPWWPLYS